ncbi:MAG: (d)CMP kinase [Clostridia bacterium]|nr:(d)CMP kinase [Clostridia bacterium]MDO5303438.1 (d)CMP kinase [Clostridia bacterium]
MSEIFQIAVDGPSGAGKSTIAKAIARKLDIDYIDTGAMYRALGYKMLQLGITEEEPDKVAKLLAETEIDFSKGDIILDGSVINDLIRTPEISMKASACSALGIVRKHLVKVQQEMGAKKSVIMDGRDIGTDVFPNAKYKFFITATAEERANRRYKELCEKGENVSYEETLESIIQRDYNDSHREVSPLRKADDAEEVDTTNMTIDEVVKYICDKIK